MEETLQEAPPTNDWRVDLSRTIDEQRRRISERVAGQRERLRELEARIAAQLEDATQTLSREQAQRETDTAARQQALTEQEQQFQVRLADLQGKYDGLRQEFDQRQQQLDQAQAELARRTAEAEQLRAETGRLAGEIERVRHEAQQQIEQFQADQGKSDNEQVKSLEKQLEDLRTKASAERTAWDSERKQLKTDLVAAKRSSDDGGAAAAAEVGRLKQANEQLEDRLAEALKSKGSGAGGSSQELEDLRRRFEMAVQDVRELKTKNAELTEQLAKARQSAGAVAAVASDWESLKKRMLAQLESDFDESDEKSQEEKLSVEGTIKITDQVVAEKDNEIAELRRLLESQSQNMGEMAVGAAAIAQVLDTDELVRQERENLQQLQEKLREELRKAEIDNSLERAKLARERAEIEERLRQFEEQGGHVRTGDASSAGGPKNQVPSRGKWLARLGLQGKDG